MITVVVKRERLARKRLARLYWKVLKMLLYNYSQGGLIVLSIGNTATSFT
jgi:hypothetical protein